MARLVPLLAASLATSALAAASSSHVARDEPIDKCTHSVETVKNTQSLLNWSGAMEYLEDAFDALPTSADDWLNTLWSQIPGNEEQAPFDGCGDVDGNCTASTDCADYPDSMTYWTFQFISVLHSKVRALTTILRDGEWIDDLDAARAEAESKEWPVDNWGNWLAEAFDECPGSAEMPHDLDPGSMSSLFSVSLRSTEPTADKTAPLLADALKNATAEAAEYLAQLMRDVAGSGDVNALPDETFSWFRHPITRFFYQPGIIVDERNDRDIFDIDFECLKNTVDDMLR